MTPKNLGLPSRSASTLAAVGNVPLASALDYATICGVKPDTLREYLRELKTLGYAQSTHFGTPDLRSEPRWWSTTQGYEARLANAADETARTEIRSDWAGLGAMTRRPDVAAVVARMTALLCPHVTEPGTVRIHYFKAPPLDCLIEFDGHRFVAAIYAGPTLPRRSLWKRLKRFSELPIASKYFLLVLTPTVFDRNICEGQLRTLGLNGVVATTSAAVEGKLICWRDPKEEGWLDYRDLAEKRLTPFHWTSDESPVRVRQLGLTYLPERRTPVRRVDQAADLNMSPLAKRFLVLLGQWVMLDRDSAIALLGVSASQFSGLLRTLRVLSLVATEDFDGTIYYALSDTGISHRSAQDRRDAEAMQKTLSTARRWDVPAGASLKDDIKSRRGASVRKFLTNRLHENFTTEAIGYLNTEVPEVSDWRVSAIVPAKRARFTVTPGERISTFRSELISWRKLSTDRSAVNRDSVIQFFPDGVVYLSNPTGDTLRILLETERKASTAREWQDRLEKYALYSLVRPSYDLPLMVVPSPAEESAALWPQTLWVSSYFRRRWPIALTTVALVQTMPITGQIWRVDGFDQKRHSLLSLPDIIRNA